MTLVKTMTLKLIIFLLLSSELSNPLAYCILPGFVLDHLFYSGLISAMCVILGFSALQLHFSLVALGCCLVSLETFIYLFSQAAVS